MGIMMDLYKKGNFVETPYNNFYEIKARDINKNIVPMKIFNSKILLVAHVSPFDENFEKEYERLLKIKNLFLTDNFEILVFPSADLDKVVVSDREMKERLLNIDIVKDNLNKVKIFNRIYLNGPETAEVFKYCYRNSPLFMYREGRAKYLDKKFSKFLISNSGKVYTYYPGNTKEDDIEKNVEYLLSQNPKEIKIREDFINFNKFY